MTSASRIDTSREMRPTRKSPYSQPVEGRLGQYSRSSEASPPIWRRGMLRPGGKPACLRAAPSSDERAWRQKRKLWRQNGRATRFWLGTRCFPCKGARLYLHSTETGRLREGERYSTLRPAFRVRRGWHAIRGSMTGHLGSRASGYPPDPVPFRALLGLHADFVRIENVGVFSRPRPPALGRAVRVAGTGSAGIAHKS